MSIILEKPVYEVPKSNMYIGRIIDVFQLYDVATRYGQKNKIGIIWVLNQSDSHGKPFRASLYANATFNEKGKLYDAIAKILGETPSQRFDCESLIDRANELFIEQVTVNGKVYANVKSIMVLPAGAVVPSIPAGFVRSKDKTTPAAATAAVSVISPPSNVNFN